MEKKITDWNFTWWLILLLAHLVVVLSLVFINAVKSDAAADRLNQNQRSMQKFFESEAKSFNFPMLFKRAH
ncbi:MAG: hypothetical protein R2813_12995 [Flavobacteriales bacterium]